MRNLTVQSSNLQFIRLSTAVVAESPAFASSTLPGQRHAKTLSVSGSFVGRFSVSLSLEPDSQEVDFEVASDTHKSAVEQAGVRFMV